MTVGPSVVKFTEWKNSAYDVWVFIGAATTDEVIPPEWWPSDYDKYLVSGGLGRVFVVYIHSVRSLHTLVLPWVMTT